MRRLLDDVAPCPSRRAWRGGVLVAALVIPSVVLGACASGPTSTGRATTTVPRSATSASASEQTTTSDPATTTSVPDETTTSAPTTTVPATTTTAPVTTTTAPVTTTTVPVTTTTVPTTTSTVVPAATTGGPAAWVWLLLALVLLAGVIAVIALAVRRRNQVRAEVQWRQATVGPLDEARLARDLLPASGRDIPDAAHWQAVRERVEQAAQTLEKAAAGAPDVEGARASRMVADAMRGLVFALEADRLLRDGTQAPTPEQLAQADTTCRARNGDLDGALDRLDRVVHPRPEGASPRPSTG